MQSYNQLIDEELPGVTPQEKYENLQAMKKILVAVAYPRRGIDDKITIQDVADIIQSHFAFEDLQEEK